MAVQVKTIITNNNRNIYTAAGGHGKRLSIRGGETVTLPYDLFSVIGKSEQAEYTRAVTRGIITIKTEVVTPENILTITPDGNMDIKVAIEQPKPEYKATVKSPVQEKKKDISMGVSGILAGTSADNMKKYGATMESTYTDKVKDVHVVNGQLIPDEEQQKKAAEELAKKESSIYTPGTGIGTPNVTFAVNAETNNVFGAEEPEQEPKEAELINGYIKDKDYTMLYAYLTEYYPEQFEKVTKTQIRKCKNWQELMELLDI